MTKPRYRTAPEPTPNMPKGIPYIIGNEAAERFSFYGMKTILFVFMTKTLMHVHGSPSDSNMSDAEATYYVHLFVWAVYFLTFFGAIISDVLLGKYRTIILLSIVYCAGHGVLAFMGVAGVPVHWLAAGLILIALGSGGIKPCVSAHVGDQFGKTNAHLLPRVFGWFYFSINMGAFISTLLTPWLLEWYGPHWAFGIPGVLMLIATIVFWMGRKVFIHVPPGGSEAFFGEAFSRKGLIVIGKISSIFVFIILFWSLFDQTSSRWVSQAGDMDRRWLGITWLPEQFQAFNPLMILAFIPLFQFVVYPAINRVFRLTPLRKISIGLFVMVGAFSIAAYAQELIDAGGRPSFGWQVLAYVVITSAEVMVSITCLEFSYTQAPRNMKSLIMALFLMTVAFGNLFTAAVNRFIMIPSDLESATEVVQPLLEELKKGKIDIATAMGKSADNDTEWTVESDGRLLIKIPAKTGGIDSLDAVVMVYSAKGGDRINVHTRTNDQLLEALEPIEEYWNSEQLPSKERLLLMA
ncbi:MAG: POT family MFS transporter [Verrucomicrobia bacterium]|nr:POT family MFS transporter [Verrucomicrobiota bacterium]